MSGSDPSQIPQLGDPFSAAASQQTAPGFLGQSPAFWQHLAMFGGNLAQAANARTPSGHLANGAGFAGPFGAAVGQTAQQSQDQSINQANVGRSRAETMGQNLKNQLQAAQMPAELLRAQFQMNALQNPGLTAALGYGNAGGAFTTPSFGQQAESPAASFPATTPAFEAGVHQNKSGGSMAPGIKGDGTQASGPMQIHPEALQDVNSRFGTNITPQLASTYPELGKWAGDRYLQLQQEKFGPVGGVAAYNAGPGRLQQALNGQATLPSSTVGYVRNATGQGGGPGDALLQQADVLTARANRIAQAQATSRLVGVPPGPGMAIDPTALHTQAQQLRQVGLQLNAAGPEAQAEAQGRVGPSLQEKGYTPGPNGTLTFTPGGPTDPATVGNLERAKAQNTATTIRGPGSASIIPQGPGQQPTIIQSPLEKEILGPDNRKWMITQNAVETNEPYKRPPGVPEWAPPGTLTAVPSHLAPGEEASQKEASEDAFGEEANKKYQAALSTIGNMAMVRKNLDILNQEGPNAFNTGTGSAVKQQIAKAANSALASMGITPWFDPDKIAAGESLEHQTKIGGMQAVSTLLGAAHEAASVVSSTQTAFPNLDNTPEGAKLLTAGLDNAARMVADRHVFMANWALSHPGSNMVGADVAFQVLRSPEKYTQRGISEVAPIGINTPVQMNQYLPGTRIYLKSRGPQDVARVPGPVDLTPTFDTGGGSAGQPAKQ